MAANRVPVNPSMLSWAREASGLDVEPAAKKIGGGVKPEHITEWEAGELLPTFNQLCEASRVYSRTPAFFFLQELPKSDLPAPTDYRSKPGDAPPSYELLRELRVCEERRSNLIELEGAGAPWGLSSLSARSTSEVADAAKYARDRLGVTIEDQHETSKEHAMLKRWVYSLEDQGVLVFQSGKFQLEEARGISLFHLELPIILLNGKDAPVGRIFTLFHEVAHLIRSGSGLCALDKDVHVERICNKFAAELLMPIDHVRKEAERHSNANLVQRLAKKFKVSREAMSIRLRENNLIDQSEFEKIQEAIRQSNWSESDRKGGPSYLTIKQRDIGRRFSQAVIGAFEQGEVTLASASRMLDLKVKYVLELQNDLVQVT